MQTTSIIGALGALVWNRFTVPVNARTIFTKFIWAGAERSPIVRAFAEFVQTKGLAVDELELQVLWQSLEAEISTLAGGAQ